MRQTIAVLMLVLISSAALAGELADDWVRQLRLDGYETITVTRTLLGRLRIVAIHGGITREVVLNRRTGEVLRDYTDADDASREQPSGAAVPAGDDENEGSVGTDSDEETGESGEEHGQDD